MHTIIKIIGAFFILFIVIGILCSFSKGNSAVENEKKLSDTLIGASFITAENIKKGKLVYEKNCLVCHGIAGKGDGSAGIYLNPRPFDISSEKVQLQNDSTLFYKITVGKAPMPSFKTLPVESRKLLVVYIRELGKIKIK